MHNTTHNSTPANVPTHVSIIMDGNGRWATQRGLCRSAGHEQGIETIREVITFANDAHISYLSLYTFSEENWLRPVDEVETLMDLLVQCIKAEIETFMQRNARCLFVGNLGRLPQRVREAVDYCAQRTAVNTGLTVIFALSYSGKWDISHAVNQWLANPEANHTQITPQVLESYLSTHPIPHPDLLIRTGGELRISNYMLWQLSYSELYFTPTLWPDFRKEDFMRAIEEYSHRKRRYGKVDETK